MPQHEEGGFLDTRKWKKIPNLRSPRIWLWWWPLQKLGCQTTLHRMLFLWVF